MSHPFESYVISVVRPIQMTTREERESIIKESHYNLFQLPADKVMIDLLTDSGTGAISNHQLAGIVSGDESYAGSESFEKMRTVIRELTGLSHVIPTHQGRAAENVLFSALVKPDDIVPGNTHFDTTKGHIEFRKAVALDCTISEAGDPTSPHPFKGNVDLDKLETALKTNPREKLPLVMMTVTCNSGGGQPVSLANIKSVKALCQKHGVPLYFDMARFAENAYFIKTREAEYADWTIPDICREMFSDVDGATMSAKKDGISAMGGFVALRSDDVYQQCGVYSILFEGYLTYGGMTGGTMASIAQGLKEATDFDYLHSRVGQVARFGHQLKEYSVPILEPVGGHAVYVDALRFLPKMPRDQFPAQALACAAYVEGGVRGVEIGTVMADRDPKTRENRFPKMELVRLAVPRRTLTDNHLHYVAQTFGNLLRSASTIPGLEITWEAPILRHFTCRFKPRDNK
ncbi:MAG: tyrosine phenol-lyase [Deltaproteobacteria bacterium CG11_big_fil_rev_8_21_14_0_20_47_16]|nr:MAG: tyrosine phenol-lyase [Deltaproteobacteria bacterium CG11_big_fil_rev_8_21_14_0_20_47_16]